LSDIKKDSIAATSTAMADRYIPEHRRTQFKAKNTFSQDALRRRREEQQVEIRKAKREENLAKRRGIAVGENRPGASLGAEPDSDDETVPTESQVSRCLLLLSCFFLRLWLRPARVPDWRRCHVACSSPRVPSLPSIVRIVGLSGIDGGLLIAFVVHPRKILGGLAL
jgi:hypothetical protein